MTWILFLEPITECPQSVRTRTDATLDQDCVLKVTVQVCTACMVVSLLTTRMNFNRESEFKTTLATESSQQVEPRNLETKSLQEPDLC